jgi:hypothetical protein
MSPVALAVSEALPVPAATESVDLQRLQDELEEVAQQAAQARAEGLGLDRAVRDPRLPALVSFHRDLRDALFVEIDEPMVGWIGELRDGVGEGPGKLQRFADALANTARGEDASARSRALAELLVFEAVRLRLAVAVWSSEDYERSGGHDDDIDAVAWSEVEAILADPQLGQHGVRPLQVMFAAACVSLFRGANARIDELRRSSQDVHDQLGVRARLRAALRELRLPEAVLLENALSNLLGEDRLELDALQAAHPLALDGMSRQAMDQRVSRGRRALGAGPGHWPRRRRPALFDLLRDRDDADDDG